MINLNQWIFLLKPHNILRSRLIIIKEKLIFELIVFDKLSGISFPEMREYKYSLHSAKNLTPKNLE